MQAYELILIFSTTIPSPVSDGAHLAVRMWQDDMDPSIGWIGLQTVHG